MGDRTAFFYGTLMAPEVLFRVCYGTSKVSPETTAGITVVPAILHNYCRRRVDMCDYPGIIAQDNHSVRGTYVTGLTNVNIARLDIFEGTQYLRSEVEVVLLKKEGDTEVEGEKKQTETYVFTAGEAYLEKREWDYEEFRRDKMHMWSDHSDEYIEVDSAAAEGHDPTGGRAFKAGDKDEVDGEELNSAV